MLILFVKLHKYLAVYLCNFTIKFFLLFRWWAIMDIG
nr:MAG TPA: hypothetical protein [Caudoviricetes sp.]